MSTQDAKTTIPLLHAPSTQGYKLIELPPDLADQLTSDNPPTLTIHSTPTAAVLKTPDSKTYSLVQKNTSNSLIILSTTQATDSDGLPITALQTIATVHETVELVPEAGEAPAVRPKGKWHEKFGRAR